MTTDTEARQAIDATRSALETCKTVYGLSTDEYIEADRCIHYATQHANNGRYSDAAYLLDSAAYIIQIATFNR